MSRLNNLASLALLFGGALTLIFSARAHAFDDPPPIHSYVDQNSVNLVNGSLNYVGAKVSVGIPEQGGMERYFIGGLSTTIKALARDNFTGTINNTGSTYTVSIGQESLSFSLSGSTFTSLQSGSTLTLTNPTTYTLVTRDGRTGIFSTAWAGSFFGVSANVARITSLARPNGIVYTYTYYLDTGPHGQLMPRIQAVTNNLGYEIKYLYRSTDSNSLDDLVLTQVLAINNAIEVCTPGASSCPGLTVNWPSISFSLTGDVVTDDLGRQATYPSPGSGTSTWIKPSGETITYTSNASAQITSVANGIGTWTYGYVTSGTTRTTTVTDPLGHTRVIVSDTTTGLVTSDKDGLNHTTSFTYDSFGRLKTITRPEGDLTTNTYDTRGNITQTVLTGTNGTSTLTTVAGFDTSCTAAAKCNQPNWIKDARGNQTDYTYNTTTGQVLTMVRPTGANLLRPETDYTYTNLFAWYKNSSGTIVQAATPVSKLTKISQCSNAQTCAGTANAVQSTMTYGTSGVANNLLLTKMTRGSGDGVLAANTSFAYDSFGNPFTQTDPLGNVTRFRYDPARRLVGLVGPDPDAGGSLLNRAVRLTYQCDATVKAGCDGLVTLVEQGKVAGQADAQWSGFSTLSQFATTYDGIDRKTLEKQTNGATYIRVTQYSYDTANRLSCSAQRMNAAVIGSLPASACTLGVTGSAGPDRITAYTYDSDDKVTKITGASATTLATDEMTYTFGTDEELLTQLDGKGNKTTIVRDAFNRVYQVQFPTPGNGGVSSTTDFEQYTYDNNNNVTQNRRRDATLVNIGYDALNQPTSGFGGSSFTYDNVGRLLTAAVSGQTLTFTYNGLNQQVSEQGPLGTINRQYDLNGNRKQLKFPDGYFVNYGFDGVGEMNSITDSGSNTLLSLLYDDLGRIASITRAVGQGPAETRGYGSDLRLSSLGYTFGDTTKNVTFGYSYNLAGQPLTSTTTASNASYRNTSARAAAGYTSDGQNKYTAVGANSLTYDGRANTTNTGLAGFTYDGLNRMTTSGANTLTYDALGRLFQVASTRLQYDGQQIIAEYNTAGTLTKRYVPGVGLDQPLISFTGTVTTVASAQWFLANGFGSIAAIGTTGAASTTAGITSYDEFGVTPAAPSWRFQYKGMPYFSEIGLYHARSRVYSQYLGRFMQPDPSGYSDGLNLYSFVHNQPIHLSDPSGLCSLGYSGCGGADPDTLPETVVICCTRPELPSHDFVVFPEPDFSTPPPPVFALHIPEKLDFQSQADADHQAKLDERCHEQLGHGTDTVTNNKQKLLQIEGMTGNRSQSFLTWLWSVMEGGAWDYKTQGGDGEAQGNFNYGQTGSIYFSPTTLFIGGGGVRLLTHHGVPGTGPYLDDSNDHQNIKDGIDAGC